MNMSWIAENDEHLCPTVDNPIERGVYDVPEAVLTTWPGTDDLVIVALETEDYAPDTGTQYRCVPLLHGCADRR